MGDRRSELDLQPAGTTDEHSIIRRFFLRHISMEPMDAQQANP